MANNDFTRFSKKVVQLFWDPLPRNEDPAKVWCLGRSYDSRYQHARTSRPATTSPSAKSDDSTASHANSAVAAPLQSNEGEGQPEQSQDPATKSQAELSRSEEEALGWPAEFLDDLESRPWLTYRSNFAPIPKSNDPAATSAMSFSTKLRSLANQGNFTSDTGWGCMIRSGQSMLANALVVLKLGRDWRLGQQESEHRALLQLFADAPEAPFSIHKFVEHGAEACGKHPGEWFGPSATARCIQALASQTPTHDLRVYVRPNDGDIYSDSLIATATSPDAPDTFHPTLILLGVRLGIDRITPVYHDALAASLESPYCVGIAGGRPSSSHYFIGHQGGQSFFYLDPHSTRTALPLDPSEEDIASCHTRRVRKLGIAELDPSMLLGFLVRSREDFDEWRKAVSNAPGKAIIHVHDTEPKYATGPERPGAVDEVEAWETGDEDC